MAFLPSCDKLKPKLISRSSLSKIISHSSFSQIKVRTNGVNAYYGPVAPVVAGLTWEVALTGVDASSTRVHSKLKLQTSYFCIFFVVLVSTVILLRPLLVQDPQECRAN